jgi:lipid-A-disaccharide synthase
MVNLVAGRQIVPEIMQDEMTGERLAAEANRLLTDEKCRERMEHDLAEVREKLSGEADPIGKAAGVIRRFIIK